MGQYSVAHARPETPITSDGEYLSVCRESELEWPFFSAALPTAKQERERVLLREASDSSIEINRAPQKLELFNKL